MVILHKLQSAVSIRRSLSACLIKYTVRTSSPVFVDSVQDTKVRMRNWPCSSHSRSIPRSLTLSVLSLFLIFFRGIGPAVPDEESAAPRWAGLPDGRPAEGEPADSDGLGSYSSGLLEGRLGELCPPCPGWWVHPPAAVAERNHRVLEIQWRSHQGPRRPLPAVDGFLMNPFSLGYPNRSILAPADMLEYWSTAGWVPCPMMSHDVPSYYNVL